MPTTVHAFDATLIARYDIRAPRYTSYPTADRFHPGVGAGEYQRALRTRGSAPLSLYLHIPFCPSPCFYCGCHREITRQARPIQRYLESLEQEITLKAALLENPGPVVQVHFGGGSPTFLSPHQLAAIVAKLRAHFHVSSNAEMGIEADPRNLDASAIHALRDIGFNRLSVGVQDFDPRVQAAINRRQSYAQTEAIVGAAREAGFHSINLDLIHGLPHQHAKGFEATLEQVLTLDPDRLALYSYAHLPDRFQAQRRIPNEALPGPEEKLQLLALAVERFESAGYVHIGMDHFAKADDPLAQALECGDLHRNFQGYSTLGGCDLIGFGVSAISHVGMHYVQNTKSLHDYQSAIAEQRVPASRGIVLTREDQLRQSVIQALMCQGRVCYRTIRECHGIDFPTYFAAELQMLAPAIDDGLVRLSPDALEVTPNGRYLLRAIAAPFDAYLQEKTSPAEHAHII
ncbi:MAG TPA: oxygen-independent coproporphyrinogen III oxidase [Candidatus Acidoferrales bacterium]|nr:oxygen-independent coproporphyrinogen III oxidase [Candidatus Acidoferrales bacterium]